MNRRLGAGSYLLLTSLCVIVWSLLTALACIEFAAKGRIGLAELNGFVSLLGTGFASVFYCASAKRLRDLNFPGWSVKVFSFPLITVIVLPVLCFLSGQRWANDYGPAAPPSGFLKIASALISCLVAIPVFRWALITYFRTRYTLVNGAF
jgi:uncharacterized membrane protein YhaH (DUF805 family)